MGELFKAAQQDVTKVEGEAKEKKHDSLQQALANQKDLFNKEVDSADKVIKDAQDKVSHAEAKGKIDGYKKDITGFLTKVAEKGRSALAKDKDQGAEEIKSIAELAGSLKTTIDEAKLYVPFFLNVQTSLDLKPKTDEPMKKLRGMKNANPPLSPQQQYDIISDAENAVATAGEPLYGWRRDSMPAEMQKIYDAADLPLKELTAEVAGYSIDRISPMALKESPYLGKIKDAKDIFEKEQPNIVKVGELADMVTTNMVISNENRNSKIVEMGTLASAALDNLTNSLKIIQGVKADEVATDPTYDALYQSLRAKINLQVKEMANIKLYSQTKNAVDGLSDEEKKCVIFGTDGIVRKTEDFKKLPPERQRAIEMQLANLKLQIAMEIDEKTADASDKQMIEGRKKLMAGDWAGAKQDLLAYYKEAGQKPEKADRVAETKGLLQGIAKMEIKQSIDRLLATKSSVDSRFNNNLGKSDTGTLMHQQDDEFYESMSRVLVKAEQMIDSGEALTIEEAESKLRSMKFSPNSGQSIQSAVDAKYEVKQMSDEDVKKSQKAKYDSLAENAKSLQEAIKRAQENPNAIGLDGRPLSDNIDYMRGNLASYQAQLEAVNKLSPQQYRQLLEDQAETNLREAKFRKALRIFQDGFVVDGQGNNAANVYDMFRQQRMLNVADPAQREANTLQLAKEARDHGLPELSRQLHEIYFQKEIDEQSKKVNKDDIRKKFLANESNQKNLKKAFDTWKEDFKKKQGQDPDEATMAAARSAMEGQMVDSAYNKAVKLKVHESFSGGSSDRAKAWNSVYGGAVAIEDFGQKGTFEAIFTDEEWNALPAKTAIMVSITIASMGVASGAVAAAGVGARLLLGEAAVGALVGVTTETGAVVGGTLGGRALAWGGGLVVEGVAFGTTQGALNWAIQGDKSTFESPGAYFKAMGHSILTLGVLKGVGAGFGKLQQMNALRGAAGLSEEALAQAAFMPRGIGGAVSEAGWWTARTSTEGAALTGLSAAQAWIGGQQYGMRQGIRDFGENFLFSAAITGTHAFMGGGAHEKSDRKAEDVTKEGLKAVDAVKKAADADTAASQARERADAAKRAGSPDAAKLEAEAKAKEAKAKELDTLAGGAMKVEAFAKAERTAKAKEAELQGHLEGMCPCHRNGMKSIIDQFGIDKITDPAERIKALDQALAKVTEYQQAENKDNHIAEAREAYRQKLLDPSSPEGKDIATKLDGQKVKVTVLNPDGTVKSEMDMQIDKRLLTPDTLLKIAAGEPIRLSEVDVYLHKHMVKGIDGVLDKSITDPALREAKRQEILDAIAKGATKEDIAKIVETITSDPAARKKLTDELVGAEEKVRQGTEVFTTPHAEMNAEGKNIAKEYMHETVNGVFDKFKEDYKKETGKDLDPALLEKIKQRIIEAGIDQHIDNPPQYVSHGFDHSLRVMENVRRLLHQSPEDAAKGPPEAVAGLMDKYKISRSQAELMTQLVGICHDFGYPTVGDMNKSLHAVTGTYRFLVDIGVPLGEAMGLDLKGNVQHMKLLKNFAESIECHSADKVETSYEDASGKRQELKFDSKIKFKIKIPGTEIFYYQEFLLRSQDKAEFREKGIKFFKENLNIDLSPSDVTYQDAEPGKIFEGRYIDAPGSTKKGSLPGGIEFRGAELSDASRQGRDWERNAKKGDYEFNPLLSLVRYADNLDMDSSRFSPFQRSKVFTNLYERLGAERSVDGDKTLSTALVEQLKKVPPSITDAQSVLTKTAKPGERPVMYEGELLTLAKELVSKGPDSMNALRRLLDSVQIVKYGNPPTPVDASYVQQIKAQIEAIAANQALPDGSPGKKNAKALKGDMQRVMADNIYADEELHASPQDKQYLPLVKKYLSTVNEVSFRHFGGCNPVEVNGVKVESGTISVGMVPDVVRRYKGLSAEERVPLPGGGPMDTMTVNIPVAVYQVWRAVEAYESVTVNGNKLKISLRVGDKTFNFDPNKYGEGSGESASAAFLREYKAWEQANIQ